MKKLWKKLLHNKLFFIFAILIIIMFPSTLYAQSDKDKTLVITTIGIDKKDDNYNLTTLAVIPKGSNDVNANLEVFSSEGKSISEALKNLSFSTGKKIGLAHCDCIILGMEATEDNIATTLDYFIRMANLSTNATLIVSDNEAGELITATKSSNNLLDLSLKNIISYQEDETFIDDITIEKFYKTYFTKSSTFYLPVLSIEKSSSGGNENSSGGGSEDAGSTGNTPGGESSGGEGGKQEDKKIKNDERILVFKNGKKERELTDDEIFIYTLISNASNSLEITLDNVNDKYVTESKEVYQQVDKTVFTKYTFENGKPVVKCDVWLHVTIDEIASKVNYAYASIDGLQNFISPTVEKLIDDMIEEKLNATNEKLNTVGSDILGIYDKYHAYQTREWKKYIDTLENENDYMDNVKIDINLHLNYVI